MATKTIEDLETEVAALEEQAAPLRTRLQGKRYNNGDRVIACTALRSKEMDNLFRLDADIARRRQDIQALKAGKGRRDRREKQE